MRPGRGAEHQPVFLYFIASYSETVQKRSSTPFSPLLGQAACLPQTLGRFGLLLPLAPSTPTMTLASQLQVSLDLSTPDALVLECTCRIERS